MLPVSTIIVLIAMVVLVGISLYFIYETVALRRERILPDQCPTAKGYFGVTPNAAYHSATEGIASVNKCGILQADPCIRNVTTLNDAITFCNENTEVCNAFVYNSATQLAIIVDTTATRTSDTSYDLYERQYPII